MHMQIKEMPVIQYMLMHTEAFRDFTLCIKKKIDHLNFLSFRIILFHFELNYT